MQKIGKVRLKLILWLVNDRPMTFNVGVKITEKRVKITSFEDLGVFLYVSKRQSIHLNGVEMRAKGFKSAIVYAPNVRPMRLKA